MTENDQPEDPVVIPITGELDLHTFAPCDVVKVLDAYFEACRTRSIHTVRVIHGKGSGTLRRTVHAHLSKHPDVVEFRSASEGSGGWGAVWVSLRG